MIKYMSMGQVKPRPTNTTAWFEMPEESDFEHKVDCVISYLLGLVGGAICLFALLF